MAKKPAYDVTKRFQEVAKRAQETGPIHTGPSKKSGLNPYGDEKRPSMAEQLDAGNERKRIHDARETRPGKVKGPNSGKDVNLSVETASSEVKDRMAKLRAMRRK